MTIRSRVRWTLVAAALVGGCVGEVPSGPVQDPVPVPSIAAISTTAAAVGDEIVFTGGGFIDHSRGWVEVTFRGSYRHEDGTTEQVNYTVEVEARGDGTVRWPRFGPYRIPFGRAGNELGVFEGEVFATNFTYDGREERQPESMSLPSFTVLPSLVIREVAAHGDGWQSDCTFVGTRLVNYVPYRMTVEAVGFEADRFTYTISAGLLDSAGGAVSEPTVIEHEAEWGPTRVDSLGDIEAFRFAEVPMGVPVYRASVAVQAVASDGSTHQQFLMLTVHQPIYVRSVGTTEVAEIYPPSPVSGCIPGGLNGRDVTYSETVSETRTISSQQTYSSNWQTTYTESHEETYGEAGSQANSIGFSSADQSTWNWNVHGDVMAGGEAGVPLVTKGKVEVRVGGGRDWGGSHTDTTTGEQSWTNTTSYAEAVTTTEQLAESMGEAFSQTWTISSMTSESLNFRTFLLPNHFGVFYRQTTRLIRRGEIVAMDLCGNESVIGELILNDYTWAPDLAMSTAECPPFPESQLPDAECLIPPCESSY